MVTPARLCSTLAAACVLLTVTAGMRASDFPKPAKDVPAAPAGVQQTAVLAGGCFWGVEAVFERLKGVSDVVSGFAGGSKTTAHYEIVSLGTTGHAEAVRITYDPSQITFGTLLTVFFAVAHDPTELNRQGPDEGTQYRSSIFYANDEQRDAAAAYIKQLDAAKVFKRRIVTTVVPLEGFYPAEPYHQDFLRRNPTYPYIVYNDLPKLRHLETAYPDLITRARR
jgi:peptide-methionine (S)-S-oxide reductase